MVLGAIWCPLDAKESIVSNIRDIKIRHGLPPLMEVKWTKVSPAKLQLYMDLVDYFFREENLWFRALVVPDKTKLDHKAFGQEHDTWYYKMYYSMLKVIVTPNDRFRIYLDIKDTQSSQKMRRLHDVLCNTIYDFDHSVIERVQTVRSHEVDMLQLADLLIGAVGYANRGSAKDRPKGKIVKLIQDRSKYSLLRSTLLMERKFNLFLWRPQESTSP
jgi:hypothetical protein